ncbi:hypothetical protein HMPREF1981_00810 [Bacteroides pyogenes F0041]|uniref:Uncharacterized protein n=1 Tax=Bacteroides pyogenes F0041 TaxID=1321819 RepID=U2C7V8_9BACE|nr:hypothetical protein HMPREF1981_00810 [Bacteroides pyogenes F0041]
MSHGFSNRIHLFRKESLTIFLQRKPHRFCNQNLFTSTTKASSLLQRKALSLFHNEKSYESALAAVFITEK